MLLLYIIVFFLALGLLWALLEAQAINITKIKLKSTKSNNKIKIVFISDLHYGDYYFKGRLKNIVNKTNMLHPDLVILGGDYLFVEENTKFNKDILHKFLDEINRIKAKHGVIAVLGNHEYYLKEHMKPLLEGMQKNNVNILINKTYSMEFENTKVLFHGLDDLKSGQLTIDNLQINEKYLNITISHNPDFFEEYNVNFDIGLSGHTHGGQINLFGLYAPVTESSYGQKFIQTINNKNNSVIVTSKGLGCSRIPIRFFAAPEIVELNIEPE
ncbi:metallophosphoesterase [Clostridium pasteurianum DSM 525 = ATCC 6013]|uniref:Calcineurin-like phosphoesterase superfamily domain containing protein n=1 Tax=Clostridium pasteurianum DSM 525 = ATCC 6013 TaxID=1262449 RepID=A0A0H3J197_CLOPA|nr:metallophosphoesterase [Clostridium pasteurianum]AJA47134.1 metallophosphoesterase [Clostridium pasteurianum DSM 525 = ATCC 6013]AJA51122.1 metallophosphoesterase [Clostridium pasteurianum DSM 525 = ATCC 6013]AOZ74495.1 metallophosphoesterase [Clostridium pasteurianum DSM 525 = ATCC 6013]AOZ78292.1 metallophosphoesterase [Clostridium pasteurianum]ELP59477.1 metallophosphoesterase [Clostridium pasteurianum DSM 525 = ATCC 6013]